MLASASGTMSNNGSYSNDKNSSTEMDYAGDHATGGFFSSDYKKHDDLKEMLDSSKDSLKLEAMKRIIGMIAKGRDASELFPAVVKNVVSKNIEVKKLVYVYLVRYAEEQQDLALLSISTFQRALKDPNQLIRAGALRVLSSIRVSMIIPIVMVAIRDAAVDMSPYVRKTAAHAIPKLYSLDPDQKVELIEVMERLLGDRTTLVVGSAVMAFEEVCPDRIDLIHKNYRKLCTLLVDVDEWGQVIILNMLTRYARTQFVDPNLNDTEETKKSFYESSDEESVDSALYENISKDVSGVLNADHRLLLRTARPLLQSRNAAVVMAVVQLYHHIAPRQEVAIAAKALVRLLRSHPEVQSVILHTIASMSIQRKGLFEPYLKNFFVRVSEPTQIKLSKLEIITNLATEGNVGNILGELQTYITSSDKKFVAAAIQAIGHCACNIKDVTDTCLYGLVMLLSSKDEAVVAECVVVIKRLLQTHAVKPDDIVAQMAKLLYGITVAQARAAILWLIGEHSQCVQHLAPDVLRRMAKTFVDEHDIVKLQVLNLAVKLWLTNREQTEQLCQYVFSLARYDQSYDIRDRVRFLRNFIINSNENGFLSKYTSKIFLASKPAPQLESRFKDREQFQLGSLSHFMNARATGYRDLPTFATEPTSSSLRDVEETESEKFFHEKKPKKMLYSDTEASQSKENSSEGSSSNSSSDTSSSENSDEETSDTEQLNKKDHSEKSSNENTDSDDEDSDSNESLSESDSKTSDVENKPAVETKPAAPAKNNLDLLLDLDDIPEFTPVMTPSIGNFLTPLTTPVELSVNTVEPVGPSYTSQNWIELINRVSGHGMNIKYRFTRTPHLFSSKMASVELLFTNEGKEEITNVTIGKKICPPGMAIHDFAIISVLNSGMNLPGILGIDFNDSSQPISLEIMSSAGVSTVSLKAPVGELLQAVKISEEMFEKEQNRLRGMYEHANTVTLTSNKVLVLDTVFQICNVAMVSSNSDTYKFSGQTLSSASLVLILIKVNNNKLSISVHCEKITIGSMLLNELGTVFRNMK